jgi:hypothetical protein
MGQNTFRTDKAIWLFAGLYSALVFFLLGEKTLNGHDPANYFLAIKYGFSLAMERPHVPGYPLFIPLWQCIGRLFQIDPHSAVLLLNAIFLFLSIVFSYFFVKKYWSQETAIIAVALIACNPMILYYTAVGENYLYDLFFSTTALYILIRCRAKLFPLVIFGIGLAMGFRLSSVFLIAPALAAVIWFRNDKKQLLSFSSLLLSAVAFSAGVLIWLYPFYIAEGGFNSFWQALKYAGVLDSTIYQNAATYLTHVIWIINFGIIFFLIKSPRSKSSKSQKTLLIAWVIIPSVFFIVHYYAKAYIILLLVGMLIPIAFRISKIENKRKKQIVTGSLIVANLLLFFVMPFVPPEVESNLPKDQRTSGERIKTALFRSISFFAPTYSHLKTADAAMTEANEMISRYCIAHSWIAVDNSAALWAYPRSLQAMHPALYFIQPNPNDTSIISLFYGSDINRRYPASDARSHDTLYYLVDSRLSTVLGAPPGSAIVASGSWTSLYIITDTNKFLFWKYCTKQL